MEYRKIQEMITAKATQDGDGVQLKRTIGRNGLVSFDPFLLLDEFCSDSSADYIGGFPEHPHRGFETVTYMLAGSMSHRDHLGNTGLLGPGSVQWMTAAHGILHSEMPQQDNGLMHGFQLWINLPACEKMKSPAYQEYRPEQIPEVDLAGGGKAKVIAGELPQGDRLIRGPVSGISTQPLYIDLLLKPQASFELAIDAAHKVLVYCYQGQFDIAGETLAKEQLALLTSADAVRLRGQVGENRCLLLAGQPLNEPIASAGPFVMNTEEQLQQAFDDYRKGVLTDMGEDNARQNSQT